MSARSPFGGGGLDDHDAPGRSPRATIGLAAGILLTLIIVSGGFTGLLLAIVLGGAGWVAGAQLDGRLDVRSILRGDRE